MNKNATLNIFSVALALALVSGGYWLLNFMNRFASIVICSQEPALDQPGIRIILFECSTFLENVVNVTAFLIIFILLFALFRTVLKIIIRPEQAI